LLTAVLSESIGRGMPAMAAAGSTVPNMGMASPSGFLTQVLRNTGGLPPIRRGRYHHRPTIVGEAGPELVVPLPPEIDAMRRQASVLRGPDPPDPSLRYRGILGLLRESYPGVADWIGNTASKIWNDPGLRMLPGPMALEIEGEELAAEALREIDSPKSVAKAIRDAQRGGRAWEKGDAFFDKSPEELKALGAKGGRHKLTPAQHADLIDRMNYSSKYEGPEPGIPETVHEGSVRIDAENPRLRDAFKLTEEEKALREIRRATGRAGALPVRRTGRPPCARRATSRRCGCGVLMRAQCCGRLTRKREASGFRSTSQISSRLLEMIYLPPMPTGSRRSGFPSLAKSSTRFRGDTPGLTKVPFASSTTGWRRSKKASHRLH